jgi:hypothetical protein
MPVMGKHADLYNSMAPQQQQHAGVQMQVQESALTGATGNSVAQFAVELWHWPYSRLLLF